WVERSEVERIYPLVPAADPQSVPRSPTLTNTPDVGHSAGDIHADLLVKELRQVIADLRADRERYRSDKDKAIADLRADRDHWRGIAERLSLPAPRTTRILRPRRALAWRPCIRRRLWRGQDGGDGWCARRGEGGRDGTPGLRQQHRRDNAVRRPCRRFRAARKHHAGAR